MVTKKNFDLLQTVFGTKKMEGSMPYAFIDGHGISIRSFDGIHTLSLAEETAGDAKYRASYTMLIAALSQLSAFDDVSIGTDGTIVMYDAAAQQDFIVQIKMDSGEYTNLLSEMQKEMESSKVNNELDTREFYIEDKAQLEEIFLFIQEECYMSSVDFAHLFKMAHLFIEETVYVTRIPESNSFVVYNRYATYMTDNSSSAE